MNRGEWQQMAREKILDAQALLNASRWASAYYLAGYAAECGLKACVLARIERTGVIFDDKDFAKEVRTHDLDKLTKLSDLEPQRGTAIQADPVFAGFWGVVSTWSEESRYQTKSRADAEQLFEAVTNNPNGVLAWIRQHW